MTSTHSFRKLTMLPAIAAVLMAAAAAQAQPLLDARVITKKMLPSVVFITVFKANGEPFATGSGFVVTANGLIVTNYHVIDKADAAVVKFANGVEEKVAGVVEFDPDKDFAILKVNLIDLPIAPLGNSDKLEQGEPLVAIGAPKGLTNTVTTGIVSELRNLEGRGEQGSRRMIQHTAAISPGSSGGPLINAAGQVVGVNTLYRTDGNSLYFALPINYVRASLASTDGKIVRLPELHEYMAKREKAQQEARVQKMIQENFAPYDDVEHLFKVLAPRDWQVQRSEKEENGTRHVVVMFYPKDTEKVDANGPLSSGIRVHLRLPMQGKRWRVESAQNWQRLEIDSTRNSSTTKKVSDPKSDQVGNLNAVSLVALSDTKTMSKPHITWLYVSATQECLATVEIVGPEDEKDDLEVVQDIFSQTFKAAWAKAAPPQQ